MFFKKTISLLILLLYFTTGLAADQQWTLQREAAGIRIHQKPTATGYALTRGELMIKAPISAVVTVMDDRTTCPRWVYACKQGRLVRQYNKTQRLDYTVIDSPLWFADRDMYLHSTASFNQQTKTLTIRLSGREQHDQGQAGRVRIKAMHGLWQLQEKSPNVTRVMYQIHGNPQLPASTVLDAYMVESVFNTLQNLQKLSNNTAPNKALLFLDSGNN